MIEKQKILIVDDRPENLFTLELILKELASIEIIQARNGNEALVAILNHTFALAILDVQMPEMDGYELAELIRSEKKVSMLPIIFVSAVYSSDYHVFKGYESGAVDFMVKPYNPQILLNKVKVFLRLDHQQQLLQESSFKLAALNGTLESRVRERTRDLEKTNKDLYIEIDKREQAEKGILKAKKEWEEIFEAIGHMTMILDKEYTIVAANRSTLERTGLPMEAIVGRKCYDVFHGLTAPPDGCPNAIMMAGTPIQHTQAEVEVLGKNYIVSCTPIFDEGGELTKIIHIATDITLRKELQKQLNQAQKLEAVGRLAGGVAHDFNNMLTIITGYSNMALVNLPPEDPIRNDLEEVVKAGKRAAQLTRQLLAFSRKQVVNPGILNLNEVITLSQKMLKRLIGEDIDLQFLPQDDLWNVLMDSSQLDQIMANLTVNARDAIEGVGQMTVQTTNIELDGAFCRYLVDVTPGQYVMLSFCDSGHGMNQDVLDHIFEPFFTTKEEGKGTGLGLSILYGVVKQSNGFIQVESALGKGTTFKIYLPRTTEDPVEMIKSVEQKPLSGTETVLIAEDEEQILGLVKKMLKGFGYQVLTASTPSEACRIAETHAQPIHLLLTDVVMPTMNGLELHEKIKEIRPEIKTLFMSGYASNLIAINLAKGNMFIPKPFTKETLAEKIREILNAVPTKP
ncbi:MAG: response regulator [Proteobacteria bacterium]|nr:response regulator [Pseudomonadota bacterium]MBU1686930.1 response regulator [Pseudomonadota bacterium]